MLDFNKILDYAEESCIRVDTYEKYFTVFDKTNNEEMDCDKDPQSLLKAVNDLISFRSK